MKKLLLLFTLSICFLMGNNLLGQTVVPCPYYDMDPSWDSSPYKSFKVTGGTANPWYDMTFRLLWPKGYDSSLVNITSYPLVLMLHGAGESALGNDQFGNYPEGDPRRFNNDAQLKHQGPQYITAVNNGKWPGFVLFPQNPNGFWTGQDWFLDEAIEIIKALSQTLKIDPNRIYVTGLSAGAHGVWDALSRYQPLFAAGIPMSGIGYPTYENTTKIARVPLWYFQGASDTSPAQYTADQTINELRNVGATPVYTVYPNTGHDTWNKAIAEPDYFPFMLRSSKLSIHVYYGKTEFCSLENINARLGISPGFSDYEWSKDGLVIPGADSSEITATEAGSYAVRFQRDSVWTAWSAPVVIKVIPQIAAPEILASGSTALPGLDGSNTVTLSAPSGYSKYIWSTGDTTQSIIVGLPGIYSVQVQSTDGCLSLPSVPKIITLLNGLNTPQAPSDLTISKASSNSLKLDWTDLSSNETGFEVYKSTSEEGPYSFITLLKPNINTFTDTNVDVNSTYYYKVRAINDDGASEPISAAYSNINEASTATVFKDCNFEGYAIGLEEGNYTLAQLTAKGILNDDISSIKIKTGYQIQLFEHDNYLGASLIITADNSCLVENSWNDRVSSLKVSLAGVADLNGTYYLQNRNSGLNMDVTSASTADGANIQQWTPNGTLAQQFQLTDLGGGVYQIINVNSGKSLDISGVNTADGANAIQWSYNGGSNQQFVIQSTEDGYYKLIAKHSSKLIEVANANTTAGANVQQWSDNGQVSGQWKLIPVNNSFSTLIQAENYSKMWGIKTEGTSDTGGGLNVGWIDNGDWMLFNQITIPSSGTYTIEYRVASPYSNGKLNLYFNGGLYYLGGVKIPNTGGWQNWTTVAQTISLKAGTYSFLVYAPKGSWNINWWKISKTGAQSKTPAREEAMLNKKENTLSLYPNPVTDLLFIDSSEDLTGSQVKIHDSMGFEVINTTLDINGINVGSLKPGFYSVTILKDHQKSTKRFIKK